MRAYDIDAAQDIAVETQAYDAQGVAQQAFAQSLRALGGTAEAGFSFGARASRPASGAQGDRYLATDIGSLGGWLYYWTGTAWEIVVGWASGTNAARAALSVSSVDNGAWFYATDTNKFWEVSGGAWADRTPAAYTDEMAQDAVGAMIVDTTTIDFTYTDATPELKADVKDDSVTYAKIQNVSATDRLLGRQTAGAGDVEEIVCTAAGRALLDDVAASNQRTTLGLGTIATQNANGVAITGGSIAGITDLAVADGGTGDSGTAWSTSTPAVSAGSGSFTSASATIYYKVIGKTCFIMGRITITTNGTAAGYIYVALPVTPARTQAGSARIQETSQTCTVGFTNEPRAYIHLYDGTYPGASGRTIDFNSVIELA